MSYIDHLEKRLQILRDRARREAEEAKPKQTPESFERGNHRPNGQVLPATFQPKAPCASFSPHSFDGTTIDARHYGVSKDAELFFERISQEIHRISGVKNG